MDVVLTTDGAIYFYLGVALTLCIAYAFHIYPQLREMVVARKLESRKVADILSTALQDAAHNGELTPSEFHRANKKVARVYPLPDMEPKKEFNLRTAIIDCRLRLKAMGVNIAEGLQKVRRARNERKREALKRGIEQLKAKRSAKGA